ncbi:uncharacterized protein LOC124798540 [Schistocerca piceifrons]|uniref:uncharacterized protein LOC124798540 n=1 Tax=Schistocerca piceifrons TaxID=274613 RepID=UPI001F5F66C7|nr:uncharacterized protein LOC124798540 [Schistocerca piceifrons]
MVHSTLSVTALLLLLLPAVLCWSLQRPPAASQNRRNVAAEVDALLARPERVDAALRCFLADGDAPCSRKGSVVKRLIYNKIRYNCAGCPEDYNKGVTRLLAHVSLHRPGEMYQLIAKNDPTGYFLNKYGRTWKAEGILV